MKIDWREILSRKALIYLNGIACNDVIEADSDAGYVERYCHDENGKLVIVGEEFATEKVMGDVVIMFEPQ